MDEADRCPERRKYFVFWNSFDMLDLFLFCFHWFIFKSQIMSLYGKCVWFKKHFLKVISAIGTFSFHFHVKFNIVNMFYWSEDAHRTFFPQVSPFRTAWLSGKESAWEMWVQSLAWEDPLEKEMATHSSILAWKSLELRRLAGYRTWGC